MQLGHYSTKGTAQKKVEKRAAAARNPVSSPGLAEMPDLAEMSEASSIQRIESRLPRHKIKVGWRARVNALMEDPKSSRLGAVVYSILMGFVLLSAFVLCLDTLEEYKNNSSIATIEIICAVAFTIEFILRVITWQGPKWHMLFSLTLIIDLLSILPFYVALILCSGLCETLESSDNLTAADALLEMEGQVCAATAAAYVTDSTRLPPTRARTPPSLTASTTAMLRHPRHPRHARRRRPHHARRPHSRPLKPRRPPATSWKATG